MISRHIIHLVILCLPPGRIILGADPGAVSRVGINGGESAQSETSIRMSRGTGSLIVAPQGLSRPFLKTFAAVNPALGLRG